MIARGTPRWMLGLLAFGLGGTVSCAGIIIILNLLPTAQVTLPVYAWFTTCFIVLVVSVCLMFVRAFRRQVQAAIEGREGLEDERQIGF